jgi:serine/threonine protein kinase
LTRIGEIMGTPEFMAPEQFSDTAGVDIRADIYALGCTLYYLLTGQPPFRGDTALDLLHAKQDGRYRPIAELRDGLPPGLIAVIDRMIAKTPSERFQTPEEVVSGLATFGSQKSEAGSRKSEVGRQKSEVGDQRSQPDSRHGFTANCPFCSAQFQLPEKALGSSVPCPRCGSAFTAAPTDLRK